MMYRDSSESNKLTYILVVLGTSCFRVLFNYFGTCFGSYCAAARSSSSLPELRLVVFMLIKAVDDITGPTERTQAVTHFNL